MIEWKKANLSVENKVYITKIDDHHGVRNIANLKRIGNLWFYPDGSMYVYYKPTHIMELL